MTTADEIHRAIDGKRTEQRNLMKDIPRTPLHLQEVGEERLQRLNREVDELKMQLFNLVNGDNA